MKRNLICAVGVLAVMLTQQSAFAGVVASSVTDYTHTQTGLGFQTDHYIGALDTAFNAPDDVIGDSYFKIHGTRLELTESGLTVTIHTNFVDDPDRYTAKFGDLFVDFFTDANPYSWDDASDATTDPYYGKSDNIYDSLSGGATKWSYGIQLTGGLTTVGGSGGIELWSLDTANYDAAVNISDDYFSSGDWRDGQEVRVNTNDATNGNNAIITGVSGSWSADTVNNLLTITLTPDSGNLSSLFGLTELNNAVGYHWAMTCANDTVEDVVDITWPPAQGSVVPEPSTAAIFGFGLLGFAFAGRRRKNKIA